MDPVSDVPDRDALKAPAAARALELVRPGMLLGVGTGSTARYFVEGIGRFVAQGVPLTGVPTSRATAARTFVVVADESKLVERLGRGTLPVEVVPFLWRDTASRLRALGAFLEAVRATNT